MPIDLKTTRSANGDGFVVWRAFDGVRHDLWVNRYDATAGAWGIARLLESGTADVVDFDVAIDAGGNAVVAWQEASLTSGGMIMGVRFDAAVGTWLAPVLLTADGSEPRVASDATGAALAAWVGGALVRGRWFDPASGLWQPEALIEQNLSGTGFSTDPVAQLDGRGNALAAFRNARTGSAIVASNYYARSAGTWNQLPPNDPGPLGAVPGSQIVFGTITGLQLAAGADGSFVLAWQEGPFSSNPISYAIRTARFEGRTQSWSAAQTVVPRNAANDVQLRRLAADAVGNALLLWTETDGARTALKALRYETASATWSGAQVIDAAVGGGAAQADLAFDVDGSAFAVWQQYEGGRPGDGSRSNIALNRYDAASATWVGAVLAETQAGNASSPHAAAAPDQALLAWIQAEGSIARVRALLQPFASGP